LRSKEYRERAEIAVKFIKEHLYKEESGELLRSVYVDENGNIVQRFFNFFILKNF